MDAKNIKVTISSENNIFSQTQGSNSFYVDRIVSGETKEQSIELKVKGDISAKINISKQIQATKFRKEG